MGLNENAVDLFNPLVEDFTEGFSRLLAFFAIRFQLGHSSIA
jgi:hypothetical protein